eukprot:5486585-Pyramimonas_sp.AAC.1
MCIRDRSYPLTIRSYPLTIHSYPLTIRSYPPLPSRAFRVDLDDLGGEIVLLNWAGWSQRPEVMSQ